MLQLSHYIVLIIRYFQIEYYKQHLLNTNYQQFTHQIAPAYIFTLIYF